MATEPERVAQVVGALSKVGRPPILENFRKDSCIASTRIGIDVLDYFGIPSVPVPLFLIVVNAEAAELLDQGMTLEELKVAMRGIDKDAPGGPWSIGIGAEIEGSSGWAGHLMVGLPQWRMLLDLSIDQADRPHKDIEFGEPQIFPVREDEWWLDDKARTVLRATQRGGDKHMFVLLDRHLGDPDGFRRSSNWHRSTASPGGKAIFKAITGQIIRLVKQELKKEN